MALISGAEIIDHVIATRTIRRTVHALTIRVFLFALFAMLIAVPAYSQSLGEIARQYRERRQENPSPATHIYDNDDLQRSHILLPEDKERFEVSKKKTEPPTAEPPVETAVSKPKVEAPVAIQIPREPEIVKSSASETILHPAAHKPRPEITTPELPALARAEAPRPAAAAPSQVVTARAKSDLQTMRAQGISQPSTVRIQSGDTLWKIAAKYLRGGKDWMLLAAYNSQVRDPMRLPVGLSVTLPREALRHRPEKEILVQRGDSLWKLARDYLGDSNAWTCLSRANPDLGNGRLIYPGQTLAVPPDCESPPGARAPQSLVSSYVHTIERP